MDKIEQNENVLIEEIKTRLIKGESDFEISKCLSLTEREYNKLKKQIYDNVIDGLLKKTAEQQYVDYCLEQQKCLIELDEMAQHFNETKQFNAMVGAIRAKSQIISDIRKTGVAMGVIKTQASWENEIAGLRVSELNNKELRNAIAKEIRNLQSHIDKFGDKPITEISKSDILFKEKIKRVKH